MGIVIILIVMGLLYAVREVMNHLSFRSMAEQIGELLEEVKKDKENNKSE